MSFAPYTPVYGCGNDGPGAANMLYWLDRESPWAGRVSNLGVCNCRGTGAGSTSQHARCRAWDLAIPMIGGRPNVALGNEIIGFLLPIVGQLGISEFIWNRTRWSAAHPNGTRYTGVSPHYDHIHAAHSLTATRYLNVPTIRSIVRGQVVVTPPPPPPTTNPPAAKPPEKDEEDMAATIRLNQPGHKQHGRVETVTSMHRRWIPGDEYALYTFLGGQVIQCNLSQFNSWTSNKQAVGTNQINGPIT